MKWSEGGMLGQGGQSVHHIIVSILYQGIEVFLGMVLLAVGWWVESKRGKIL